MDNERVIESIDNSSYLLKNVINNLTETLTYEDQLPMDEGYQNGIYKQFRFYIRYIIPVFCVIGILGNSMALIILKTNYWLKRLTSNAYLTMLSVCSCIFISCLFIVFTDTAINTWSFYSSWTYGCKLFTFLPQSSDFVCSWMICWVSFDRVLILYRPKLRKYICNKKFANYAILGTILIGAIFYSWCFYLADIEYDIDGRPFCGLRSDEYVLGISLQDIANFFLFFDLTICTILPSIFIVTVNCLSIYRYRECMKIYASGVLRVRFLKVPSTETNENNLQTGGGNGIDDLTHTKKTLFGMSSMGGGCSGQSTTNTNTKSKKKGNKLKTSDLTLTRSLLIVTSTFICLQLPNYALRIYQNIFNIPQEDQPFNFILFMSHIIYYAHHAVLFYMYIFWSPQMKKQLKPTALKLIECYCCKAVPEFGHGQSVPYMKRGDRNYFQY
uniref:G_PROTEIN_RECEP_F1_2 domain-containing protein n=1 Tax=Strongyloides papillosus TaxID=174720 RepID=A0A0N5BHS7_STREA